MFTRTISVVALIWLAACSSGSSETTLDASASEDADADAGVTPAACSMGETCDVGGGTAEPATGSSPAPCFGGCEGPQDRPEPLPRPECPTEPPQATTACEADRLVCSYGESDSPECRDYLECADGAWRPPPELDGRLGCREDLRLADYCPPAPAHQEACVADEAGGHVPCMYGDLSCYCRSGSDAPLPGQAGNWACFGPPMDERCPAFLPRVGEGCSTQGVECYYAPDGCIGHPYSSVFCYDGAWEIGSAQNCLGG